MYKPCKLIYDEISECKWIKQIKYPFSFDTVSVKKLDEKEYCKNVEELFKDMWVWDCETYWEELTALVFYCGIADVLNCNVSLFKGKDCINLMVNYIDGVYSKLPKLLHRRTHVYLWAHNSKGFDSYIVLNQKGLKFKNIVKNGSNILRLDVLTNYCKI